MTFEIYYFLCSHGYQSIILSAIKSPYYSSYDTAHMWDIDCEQINITGGKMRIDYIESEQRSESHEKIRRISAVYEKTSESSIQTNSVFFLVF